MQLIAHFVLALFLFSSAMALSTPEKFMPEPQYNIQVEDFTLARERNTGQGIFATSRISLC